MTENQPSWSLVPGRARPSALDRELVTALKAAGSQDGPASLSGHADTKAMSFGSLTVIGLVRALHDAFLTL